LVSDTRAAEPVGSPFYVAGVPTRTCPTRLPLVSDTAHEICCVCNEDVELSGAARSTRAGDFGR
jgi:hypothetical protein